MTASNIIYGTTGNDTITGTSVDEIIYAYAGDDRVNAQNGNNTLYGGDGQ